jgi:hypothetical protein
MNDSQSASQHPDIPPDDPRRHLSVARPDKDQALPHLGIVGDTYTILLTGEDTAGRYTLIDMHVPPGGGPLRTATTSRKCSPCSTARSSSPSAANN